MIERTPSRPTSRRRPRGSPGVSLLEMIVVLAIVSTLAAMAVPYARKSMQREKELALRATLRETREAIDRFHADWAAAKGGGFGAAASAEGYPVSFDVLVDGVDGAGAKGGRRRYLRKVPRNPLSPAEAAPEDQWRLIGYLDDPKAAPAGKAPDIYDLRPNLAGKALDGTDYADW